MIRETGMAMKAAPTADAEEATPLNVSDERSAASNAPTAAPDATPIPPSTWAEASTLTTRFCAAGSWVASTEGASTTLAAASAGFGDCSVTAVVEPFSLKHQCKLTIFRSFARRNLLKAYSH